MKVVNEAHAEVPARGGGRDQLGENVYFHTLKFLTRSACVSVRAPVCVQDQQTL